MLVNRVHKPFHCKICGSTSQIKVCKCQKVYYCSKNCQKIDWKTHKGDCYATLDIPSTQRTLNGRIESSNNGQIVSGSQEFSSDLQQQNIICARTGQHESQQSQYQQMLVNTNTNNSKTENQLCSTSTDESEENLFNSLLFSVDEGTEREILKNLEIGDEDLLLRVCQLDGDNSFSFDDQSSVVDAICAQSETVGSCANHNNQQPSFDDEILEAIQRKKSFEYQPEAQRLLKETRENLEKELSMFQFNLNLSEVKRKENSIDLENSDDVRKIMQYKNNPKYQSDGRIEDHLQR